MRLFAGPRPYSARADPMGDPLVSSMLAIEVVFATAERQEIIEIQALPGTTVAGAIAQSGIRERFSDALSKHSPVGVWGRLAAPDYILKSGDRVEIYRQLRLDPREARRLLALQGRSMNQGIAGDNQD